MSKPIGEWFQELPEDVKDRAIKNAGIDSLGVSAPSLHIAILNAFVWTASNEGFMYWNNIYTHYEMNFEK